MAEFCLPCWNKLNNTNLSGKESAVGKSLLRKRRWQAKPDEGFIRDAGEKGQSSVSCAGSSFGKGAYMQPNTPVLRASLPAKAGVLCL